MDQNSAQLKRYLKKEIMRYLDEKALEEDKQAYTFISELDEYKQHVKDEEFENAIDTFAEMIERYNAVEEQDEFKEVLFDQLYEAYDFSKERNLSQELEGYIDYLRRNQIFEEEVPDTINILQERKKKKREQEFKQAEQDYEKRNEIYELIQKLQNKFYIAIKKENVTKAKKIYALMKKYFKQYPNRFKDEKEEIYNDILSAYMQIKKVKNKKDDSSKDTNQDEPSDSNKPQKEVEQTLHEIEQKAEDGEIQNAKNQLLDLKHHIDTEDQNGMTNFVQKKIKQLKNKIHAKEKMEN